MLLIADAYYASSKVILSVLAGGHQLLTRAKGNVVAHLPAPVPASRGKGRPKRYGDKVRLKDAAKEDHAFIEAPSPVYGENNVLVRYRVMNLIWRPSQSQYAVPLIRQRYGDCYNSVDSP